MKTPSPLPVRTLLLLALSLAGAMQALPAHADRGIHFRGGLPAWGRVRGPAPMPAPLPRLWSSPGRHDGYRGSNNGWWIVGSPWMMFPPPYYNYPPAVVQQEAPIVLPNLPPAPQSWYYCESAKSYYPYAQTCPEGWRSVPAAPTGSTQAAPADTQNWYYCDSAKGYYPYVQRCPEAWRPVAATPPAAPAAPAVPEGALEE